MGKFLDTRGEAVLSPYICDRCKIRGRFSDMVEDGDKPGLFVHKDGCSDRLDPWKLPARSSEDVSVPSPRPDSFVGSGGPELIPGQGNYGGKLNGG